VAKAKEPKRDIIGGSPEQQGALEVKPVIEKLALPKWVYLVAQAHPWKKQLFVKARNLPAAAVWTGMIANDLSVQEAAENLKLSVDAVEEILEYCQANRVLLEMEAQEELRILEEKGIGIVAKNSRR
jgi:hypothetical protein